MSEPGAPPMSERPSGWLELAFIVLGWLTALTLANQLFRHSEAAAWLVLVVLPPLALPRILSNPKREFFGRLKTASVLLACALMLLYRQQALGFGAYWATAVWLALIVNMGEAIVDDARRGQLPNVLAGVLLLATLPGPSQVRLASSAPHDLLFNLGWPWILAYTVWNLAFVVNRKRHLAAVHAAVLGAPLLSELVAPDTWIQARAFTLGLHQLFSVTFWELRHHRNVRGRRRGLDVLAGALTSSPAVVLVLVLLETRS